MYLTAAWSFKSTRSETLFFLSISSVVIRNIIFEVKKFTFYFILRDKFAIVLNAIDRSKFNFKNLKKRFRWRSSYRYWYWNKQHDVQKYNVLYIHELFFCLSAHSPLTKLSTSFSYLLFIINEVKKNLYSCSSGIINHSKSYIIIWISIFCLKIINIKICFKVIHIPAGQRFDSNVSLIVTYFR
jgi:hypothetical protein